MEARRQTARVKPTCISQSGSALLHFFCYQKSSIFIICKRGRAGDAIVRKNIMNHTFVRADPFCWGFSLVTGFSSALTSSIYMPAFRFYLF